jgi:hypothetical protein
MGGHLWCKADRVTRLNQRRPIIGIDIVGIAGVDITEIDIDPQFVGYNPLQGDVEAFADGISGVGGIGNAARRDHQLLNIATIHTKHTRIDLQPPIEELILRAYLIARIGIGFIGRYSLIATGRKRTVSMPTPPRLASWPIPSASIASSLNFVSPA